MPKNDPHFGTKHETGERIPKGASDRKGERHDRVPKEDKERTSVKAKEHSSKGETGERIPDAAKRDSTGERHEGLNGGVGMGMKDGLGKRPSEHMGKADGRLGEFNTGRSESKAYEHKKH
jgi:hypothetical protein